MCLICECKYNGLQEIELSCPTLTHVPVIPGLQILICWNCPKLTEISIIPGLQELECYFCPSLTDILVIENGLELGVEV